LLGVVRHLADRAREQNPLATHDDVGLEPADAVGELLDVMVPAPFAVADDVNAGEFLQADGKDHVLVHARFELAGFHPAFLAGKEQGADGLGAGQAANHLGGEQREPLQTGGHTDPFFVGLHRAADYSGDPMERKELLHLARQVLTIPTAPYHEHGVQRFVIAHCRQLGLQPRMDRWGNVIVRYVGAPFRARSVRSRPEGRSHRTPPLVLVAHMDHPGFESLGGDRVEFLGGVPPELFPRARIRFGHQTVRVVRVTGRKEMRVSAPVPRGTFGMWDVPAFRLRDGKLHACAIDDVLSVVVILATLSEVVRQRVATHLWGVFTRAEEVGFNGAVEVARSGVVPKAALVISMEMSKQRPWARIGHGPVIRVGDRMTMFDPAAAWFLERAARDAVKAQRALMDGGTCEATTFAGFGYRVGGLCLPLGNYHNIGRGMKPRAEYVSVSDLEGLVKLTVAAARAWRGFSRVGQTLRKVVLDIRCRAPRKLQRCPNLV